MCGPIRAIRAIHVPRAGRCAVARRVSVMMTRLNMSRRKNCHLAVSLWRRKRASGSVFNKSNTRTFAIRPCLSFTWRRPPLAAMDDYVPETSAVEAAASGKFPLAIVVCHVGSLCAWMAFAVYDIHKHRHEQVAGSGLPDRLAGATGRMGVTRCVLLKHECTRAVCLSVFQKHEDRVYSIPPYHISTPTTIASKRWLHTLGQKLFSSRRRIP